MTHSKSVTEMKRRFVNFLFGTVGLVLSLLSAPLANAQNSVNLNALSLDRLDSLINEAELAVSRLPFASTAGTSQNNQSQISQSGTSGQADESVSVAVQQRGRDAPLCFGDIEQPLKTIGELNAKLAGYQTATLNSAKMLDAFELITGGQDSVDCNTAHNELLGNAEREMGAVNRNDLQTLTFHLSSCRVTDSDVDPIGAKVNPDVVYSDALQTLNRLRNTGRRFVALSDRCGS